MGSRPLTAYAGNYYYSPLMSKAPPERIHPLRLAHHGETLIGSVGVEQMPRLGEMLHQAAGQAEFELRFDCDDGGQARVLGRVGARLAVLCQRCLEPMDIAVERHVSLALVRGDAEAAVLDATYDPLLVGDQPVSLAGLLEDELILAMPNFCRHPRGACEMPRGADGGDEIGAQQEAASGVESGQENPFSVLEPLKTRKTPSG